MSIKIIKNTMVEPITVECKNCKSVISYTYDDIMKYLLTEFNGTQTIATSVYNRRFVICPVCKANIDIDKIQEVRNETN